MAKRGNPGYGKLENIRENYDKFSPVFWTLMEEFSKSKSKEDKRFFVQEFNKIQTKMIPHASRRWWRWSNTELLVVTRDNYCRIQLREESVIHPEGVEVNARIFENNFSRLSRKSLFLHLGVLGIGLSGN